MADGKVWTFEQLGGDRKTLSLSGWAAPFGRPRQGTIVNAGVSVRKSVTFYPGGQLPPTVHSFGKMGKPWLLRGRWMDGPLALADGAKAQVRAWKDFIEDEQEVRAKWGDILTYRIFIHDFDANFESEAHVAWELHAEVLVDEQSKVQLVDTPVQHPQNTASLMADLLGKAVPWQAPQFGSILDLLPEISDAIDTIISDINTPFALIFDTASALSDFETALSSDLVKMGSGLQEMTTALVLLRNTTDFLVASAALQNEPTTDTPNGLLSGESAAALASAKASADANTANLLALIADMQVQIDITTRGQTASAHAAQQGDTWESIAKIQLGDPSGARAIKAANAIRYGTRPQPGRIYSVPRS